MGQLDREQSTKISVFNNLEVFLLPPFNGNRDCQNHSGPSSCSVRRVKSPTFTLGPCWLFFRSVLSILKNGSSHKGLETEISGQLILTVLSEEQRKRKFKPQRPLLSRYLLQKITKLSENIIYLTNIHLFESRIDNDRYFSSLIFFLLCVHLYWQWEFLRKPL